MTKTFKDIIPYKEGYVVVDKEANKQEGDSVVLNNVVFKVSYKLHEPKESLEYCQLIDPNEKFLASNYNIVTLPKVIASIGITIEGVPLIEEDKTAVHRELLKLAFKDFELTNTTFTKGTDKILAANDWVRGYKAAQKQGQYSEEDMIKLAGMMAYEMHTNGMGACSVFNHKARSFWEDIKDKFQPKRIPISVSLEYEPYDIYPMAAIEETSGNDSLLWRLKISKENTIIPKSINYGTN